jgi:hypothetical protein
MIYISCTLVYIIVASRHCEDCEVSKQDAFSREQSVAESRYRANASKYTHYSSDFKINPKDF